MNQLMRRVLMVLVVSVLACSMAQAGEPEKIAFDPPLGTRNFLRIDFESTPVGQVPSGFTKTGNVGVVDDVAHTGHKSLRMNAAERGPRQITLTGNILQALAGEHWGRLYFKVQMPAPLPEPAAGKKYPVIHSTLVSGTAVSPLFKDAIDVRLLGMVLNTKGAFQYIYNVQPRKRPEFAHGGGYTDRYTNEWTLAEWHVDYATQTYQLFINGKEIKGASFSNGAGHFEKSEIPQVFQTLSFGWNNYQPAGEGFVAWIDDLALGKDRIGDRGLTPEPKSNHRR